MKKGVKKKIFTLVQSGQLMKLKHYVDSCQKKFPDFHLNFLSGDMNRSPLHIACLLGDDAITRCLLNHGANADIPDKDGDTALHLAAKYVGEEGNYTNHKLLIDPLLRNFPNAISLKNKWNENPSELLLEAKRKHKLYLESTPQSFEEKFGKSDFFNPRLITHSLTDHAWNEKLANSMDEDCAEAGVSGSYFNDVDWVNNIPEYDTFDQWADRMAAEYKRKRMVESEELKRKKADQKRQKAADNLRMVDRLEGEREKYRKTIAQKKANRLKTRHDEYRAKLSVHMSDQDSKRKLRFKDIPWPCLGTINEMIEVVMSGYTGANDDTKEKRKYILKQQILWHPDKFMQRCINDLDDDDKESILDTVKLLSQNLNMLLKNV